ncbi:MAG: AsmA family protein [Psychromonas sp.]
MKRLIKLSISIVALLFVALLLLSTLINPNDYKPQIEAQVKKSINRDLHIKGEISWEFYPQFGFSSGEIALDNLPGFNQPHLLKIKQASIGINILPLLSGEISLSKLTLDGFELTLLTDKNGLSNLDNMSTKTDSTEVVATETSKKTSSESTAYLDLSQTQLDGIDIKNAVIEVQNLQTDSYQKITLNEIKLGQFAFNKETLLTINSQVMIDDLHAEIKLTTQLLVDNERHNITLNKLRLQTNLSTDALPNGQLTSTLKTNINYALKDKKVTLNGLDIHTIITGDNLPNKQLITQINADITYQLDNQKASITHLKVAVDTLRLDGEMSVQIGAITKVRYNFVTNQLDLTPYLNKSDPKNSTAQSVTQTKTAQEIEPDLSFLKRLDIIGDLKIAAVKIDNLTLGEINKHLIIKQGKAQLKPLTVELYQGLLTVNAEIDESNGLNKYQIVSKLKDMQLYPLLTDMAELEILSGTTHFNFSAHGQGLSATKIPQGIIGQGDFALFDGELYGVNLSQELRIIKAKIKGDEIPSNDSIKKTDFASLTGTFSIQKGQVNNQKLLMLSPIMRLDGSGLVNIIKQSLDYKLSISPLSKTTKQSNYSDLQGLTIPLLITGTLTNPRFSIDINSVLKAQLAEQKEKLQEKVEKAITEKLAEGPLKDVLKSFF